MHVSASKLLVGLAIVTVLCALAVRSEDSEVEARGCTVSRKTKGTCLSTCAGHAGLVKAAKLKVTKKCPAHKVCCVKKAKKPASTLHAGSGSKHAPPSHHPGSTGTKHPNGNPVTATPPHGLVPNVPGILYGSPAPAPPPSPSAVGVYDDAFNQAILAAHNSFRADIGVPPLQINQWLAEQAYLQATNGYFHQQCTGWVCGQNICEYPGSTDIATDCAGLWWDEGAASNYGCVKDDGVNGHYTQMAWRATKQLGCAQVGDIVFCNYNHAGNMPDQKCC